MTAQGLLACTVRFFEREELSVTPLADQVDRGIRGDARYPGAQVVLFLVLRADAGELREPGHRLQECFLAHVFRVCGISRHSQRPPVQP